MSKPKILVFINTFFPGYKAGGPTQSILNFVALLKTDFDISVVCGNHDFGETTVYPNIKSDNWTYSEDLGIDIYYISDSRVNLKNIKQIIKNRSFDFLYLNSLWNFQYTFLPLLASRQLKKDIKVVLNVRGELNPNAIRIKKRKKQVFLFLFKLLKFPKNIIWNATNKIEEDLIRHYFGKNTHVRLLSNIPKQQQVPWSPLDKKIGTAKIIFLSRISPMKNLDFLLRALQGMKTSVSLDLYGPLEDADYWQECKDLISTLPDSVIVNYKRQVPAHEVARVLSQYHFFILPTRGENFGHAIFEALLQGKPVIISEDTPWRNLEEKQIGWDLTTKKTKNWLKTLQRCEEMSFEEYQIWSKKAWDFAKEYRESPILKKQAKALFS